MSDYTPTTEEVREDYALGRNEVVGAEGYDPHRAEFYRWLAAHDAEKRAEWEAEAALPPCDAGCDYNSGPDETCSAHGRPPAEIWEIVASVAAERDAAQGQLGEAEHVIEKVREIVEPPKPLELGKSMMRSFDRMIGDLRRALATYKPINPEGGNDGT